MVTSLRLRSAFILVCTGLAVSTGRAAPAAVESGARLFPLEAVRLLGGPFAPAVAANRDYLLRHDPDRLLAPFLREAGLEPRAEPYGNWEGSGLGGHTAGHYLSALAAMIASGADADGELRRRLNTMLDELHRCQAASGTGYLGGVPGSRELWADVAAGRIKADSFALNGKWVPWYNVHKTFVGLRDAVQLAGSARARELLVGLGDWCVDVTSGLTDAQMQEMLRAEHGGMNEALADIYALTQDEKYLRAAQRFSHRAVLEPLRRHEDELTGKHANTQIPKVIGLARISAFTGDAGGLEAARYFWETVTGRRSVAFGGNSVSEHFNDPEDFHGMLEHREGPETCNTYNMLRLTEQLFEAEPRARYVDYYERALYNHLLASIHPEQPGYVYFTPIRPGHYRVYSQPEHGFWCCVGTGMENPGKYGQFIYAAKDADIYVNLFIPSELTTAQGVTLRQETEFPEAEQSRLTVQLDAPATFALHVRHPGWVAADGLRLAINGEPVEVESEPSSFVALRREWRNGDRVEVTLPMRTTVEGLPDGSPWYAILRGPIVLAAPVGTEDQEGLRAGAGRGDHIPRGPVLPLEQLPALLTTAAELPDQVRPDPAAGPLAFRLHAPSEPAARSGIELRPFFRLHDVRYQMYFEVTTPARLAERQARLAAEHAAQLAREAATLDHVRIGEQQPEVDHEFAGEETESGEFQGRRWRHGKSFQYTLALRGAAAAEVSVTYSGWDNGRDFDVLANGVRIATERLRGERAGGFFEQRYPLPPEVLAAAPDGRIVLRFVAHPGSLAGGVFDVRLMRP